MTSLVEEARWAKLRNALEDRFASWGIPYPADKADRMAYELRMSGWRVPLPEDSRVPPRGRPARPEAMRRHADECRKQIRNSAKENE